MTDFELHGLSTGSLDVTGRSLLLTVDVEAFDAATIPLWSQAMARWAERAESCGLHFTYFLSIEDVVRVRSQGARAYAALLTGLQKLEAVGGSVHPHNHRLFDRAGMTPTSRAVTAHHVHGYPRRASVFYDVVHRHRKDWAAWMIELRCAYEALMRAGGLPIPGRLAFRPGGWDHGTGREQLQQYVEGLRAAQYQIDSSATSGTYGEASWMVGAPAGSNVFGLAADLVEIAPCASFDCGAPIGSRATFSFVRSVTRQRALWSLPRRDVALVIVLHFDHLFHSVDRGQYRPFAIKDEQVVYARIEDAFARLSLFRYVARAKSRLLEEVHLIRQST